MRRQRSIINATAVSLTLGSLLMFEASAMLICFVVSLICGGGDLMGWIVGWGVTSVAALTSTMIKRKIEATDRERLKLARRDGYLIVSLVWIVFTLFGSIPFYVSGYIPSYTDAFFETISAFTTTGATIMQDVEVLPRGLALWRCMMQWVGGMGIIVLSLAVLPFLGIGGMQLYMAEVPGPTKDKLSPRIMQTAQILYGTYIAITLSEVVVFYILGMEPFDAICHALTTISTGGFSTSNEGISAWHSPALEWAICVYMFLAGVNFTVTYHFFRGNFSKVKASEELKFYIGVILVFGVIICIGLLLTGRYTCPQVAIRESFFETIALTSGCGYVLTDINTWHGGMWGLLVLSMVCGGCAGSAAGGIKIMRVLLLIKNSYLEFKRMLHPQAVIPAKFGGKVIEQTVITNILAFVVLYTGICMISIIVFMISGNAFLESTGMAITCLSNCGPGLGTQTAGCFYMQPAATKWFMALLMLLGRLEIFTLLFVFMPTFWRRS